MHRGLTGSFERLSPRDAAFIYDEHPRHHELLVACYAFGASDGSPAWSSTEGLHAWMRARLGAADFLTRRLRFTPFNIDLPSWVPVEEVNLAEHVHLHTIADGWPALREMIRNIASLPIDLHRPPWELHAVNGALDVDSIEVATVMVLKVHHCAADGMVMRALEARLFGTDRVTGDGLFDESGFAGGRAPVTRASAPHPPAHGIETAVRAAARAPWQTLRFARHVVKTRSAVTEAEMQHPAAPMADTGTEVPVRHRPATRFNEPLSGGLTLEVIALPLVDVRAARSTVHGATVNDVLLTAVGGAIRRLLTEDGEEAEGSLAALVPISLRLPDSQSGGTRKIEEVSSSANQLALGTVDLHTDIADPASRLAAVAAASAAEKSRWMDPQVRRAGTRLDQAPSWLLALRGWTHRTSHSSATTHRLRNTTVSNLPAPDCELSLAGAPLRSAFGVLPIVDGDRLRHLFTSCGDRIFLCVSADQDVLADPAEYVARIADEVTALLPGT